MENTQENAPEEIKGQKTKKKYGAKTLLLGGIVIIIIAIAISDSIDTPTGQPANVASNIEQAEQINTPVAENVSLPEDSQKRIEAIVKSLSPNYEVTIFDKNSNMGSKIQPPFEIIINADTTSCMFAKQINFDLMSKLYSDPIARKNIARMRLNVRKYLSTSLGGDDAREMAVDSWRDSGPTNFLKVLTQMGSGDLSIRDMERQTWGKPLEGCQ